MDPISILSGLVTTVISRVWPDKTEQQKQQFILELQTELNKTDLLKGQLAINQAEASNSNLFVAGWRPFIGWVCGLSFAWQFLLQPIVTYLFVVTGHHAPVLPVLDTAALNTVLLGMLGLAGMRTYEKTRQ